MALVGQPFAATFSFSRPAGALHRDATGAAVTAPTDTPRFDHDPDGVRLGLLIGGGGDFGQEDRCRVVAGDWEVLGPATVLHEYGDGDGAIVRRAYYSTSVRATVNAVLSMATHHRVIAAAPGHLRNRGGHVRYSEFDWALPAAIATGGGEVIGDASAADRVVIEG